MKKNIPDILPNTARLFRDNLELYPFRLSTPQEVKISRRLEKIYSTIHAHHRVLFFPSMHKKIKDKESSLSKKYDKSLRDFKELAQECSGNIKTTALCMGYFCEISLTHDVVVQPNVRTNRKNKFNTYFNKVEKELFETVDSCNPSRHERELWNAKNFAMMAYASAKHQRENSFAASEIDALVKEARLTDREKGPRQPS